MTDLKTLCLATMTAEWRPLAAQATRERRIQRRLQEARFPMLKTLDAFQFDA